jgi:Xaa-Pro aminopeptidase
MNGSKNDFPTLSIKERDRRWEWTRAFLAERDLDCLLMFGLKGRERYESYLSNEWADGLVIFPRESDPVHLTWATTRVLRRIPKLKEGKVPWIEDIRIGQYGPTIISILRERGLGERRIGVVGLESRGPAEGTGVISYNLWTQVLTGLPDAEFVEVSLPFALQMLVKSDEELALFRFACEIGERACRTMLDATHVGASEYEIYASIMQVIHSHGAFSVAPHLIVSVGANNLGWGHPLWALQGGQPRIVRSGDMVQAEIFPCYGGIETQVQLAIAIGPVNEVHMELAQVARKSYEAGVKVIRPGVTFQEVCDSMGAPVFEAGCWHLTPLIHSLAPLCLVSGTSVGIEQMPGLDAYKGIGSSTVSGGDLVLKEGMLFELEPNACKTDHRVNIGGSVLVTSGGAEELNKIPTEMRVVG